MLKQSSLGGNVHWTFPFAVELRVDPPPADSGGPASRRGCAGAAEPPAAGRNRPAGVPETPSRLSPGESPRSAEGRRRERLPRGRRGCGRLWRKRKDPLLVAKRLRHWQAHCIVNPLRKVRYVEDHSFEKDLRGGGKVLSLILAGTLALGMTPAAALSQAALDVTPAYASGAADGSSKENAIPLTSSTIGIPEVGTVPEGGTDGGWSDVSVKFPTDRTFTYSSTASSQVPTSTNAVAYVKYTYYEDNTEKTRWYEVAGRDLTPVYKLGTAPIDDPKNAGTYTLSYTLADEKLGTSSTETNSAYIGLKAVQDALVATEGAPSTTFEIQKAKATVTLAEGIVGVSTVASLSEGNQANTVTPAVGEAVTDNYAFAYGTKNSDNVSLVDSATGTIYVTAGVVPVTITVANEKDNYDLFVGNSTTPLAGTPGDTGKTNYIAQAAIKDSTYAVATKSGNTGVKPTLGNTALDVPYSATGIDADVKSGISVQNGTTPVNSWTVKYLDDKGSALVDSKGEPAAPTAPGKYEAQVKIGDKVVGTVPVTVYVDLSTMVSSQATTGGEVTEKIMTVLVDGRYPDWVKIAYEEGMNADKALAAIEDGMTITLKDADGKDAPVAFTGNFVLRSSEFTAGDQANNVATLQPASDSTIYRGSLPIKYSYGADLPAVSLNKASETYNGSGASNGYVVKELIKFASSTKPTVGTDCNVTATLMNGGEPALDADGDPIVATNDDRITEAGTYKIEVASAGTTFVGKSEPMTFTIDPLPVSYGGKTSNVTLSYGSELTQAADKSYSATFTGGSIEPDATVEVKIGTANVSVAETTDPKDPKDYTVAYGENTNVAQGGTITYTFSGNYSGEFTVPFSITPASLLDLRATVKAANQLESEFKNTVVDPKVSYTVGSGPGAKTVNLVEGVDYTIVGPTKSGNQNGVADGTRYAFTVKGMGNYSDAASAVVPGEFLVTDKTIEGMYDVVVKEGSVYDSDEPATPDFKVYLKGSTTDEAPASNYSFSWENNENATTEDAPAYLVINGAGQYAGQIKVPFQIAPLELSDASNVKGSVKLTGAEGLVYNGKEQVPTVSIKDSAITPVNKGYDDGAIDLKEIADDVTFGHEGGVNAGTSYVTIVPKNGNFTGQVKVPYEIAPAELKADNVAVAASTAPGADAAVSVTFGDAALAAGTDYTVATEGTLPGKVKATVTGTGNFTGTVEKEAAVLYDVAKADVSAADAVYNGKAQTPKVEVGYTADGKKVVVPADAYAVSVPGGASNAGTYQVTVTGKASEGWTGEKTVDFVIKPAAVTAKPQVSYDAAGLPVVTVPGLSSNDFTYKADPATKTITVTYKGNYAGTATVAYAPTAKPVAPAKPAAGKTGWVGSGNDWAYYEDGQAVKGQWKFIDGAWYHFEANGKMTNTRWLQDGGEWYLLNQSHKGQYGAMLTGWQKVGGDWYYMDKSGAMQSGWAKVKGEWYLLNTSHDGTFGKMLTGWQQVGGKWYYMDASGAMAENEWVGRYWVNGSGVWTATR